MLRITASRTEHLGSTKVAAHKSDEFKSLLRFSTPLWLHTDSFPQQCYYCNLFHILLAFKSLLGKFKFIWNMCRAVRPSGTLETSIFVNLWETFPKTDIYGLSAHQFYQTLAYFLSHNILCFLHLLGINRRHEKWLFCVEGHAHNVTQLEYSCRFLFILIN